jgi:murein DD-endopeptidase MepM/ murein hydrolase activator NlpD
VKLVVAAVAAAALAVPATAAPAAAKPTTPTTAKSDQRQQQIKGQINTLRSQVAEASADEENLLGQIDDSDARLEALDVQVAGLDRQILTAQDVVAVAQSKLNDAESRLLDAGERLARAARALAAAQDEMHARALAAYTGGPALEGAADLLLRTSSARDLVARTEYMHTVLEEQQRTVERYRRLRDEIGGLKASLASARQSAFEQRNEVAHHQVELQDARNEQDKVRQEAAAQHQQREQLLAQVRARKSEFQAQIASLQQESNSITVLLQTRQAGVPLQAAGRGVLGVPIPGAPITSPFGSRVHPIFGDVRVHTGIDFGAGMGTPIRAAAAGVVVFAGPRGGYGNATIIDHGGSIATLYGHQSALLVQEGQQVVKGQVIGRVGATGFATGPHLHFEVRVAGTPVDPLTYL